jgi:phage terminase large subunit-like protein
MVAKVDGEKQVYDVTVRLIEEYLQFPFGAHDDLLDALSRCYDLQLVEPVIYSKKSLDPPVFADS